MNNDGKHLEGLVALVEKLHLPQGFEVKTNEKIYNGDDVQIAEFDIEVRGRVGTTQIAWLIECRDRPGHGPAPGSWIEQLVGRRTRFQFDRVTAVSTTGFAQGAMDFAREQGIEIREVKSLSPEHFADWLTFQSFPMFRPYRHLTHATLIIEPNESPARQEAFIRSTTGISLQQPFLRAAGSGEIVSTLNAFSATLSQTPVPLDAPLQAQPTKKLNLHVCYPDDKSHFVVDTDLGPIRVREIVFIGEFGTKSTEVALAHASEYSNTTSGKVISQSAAFDFAAFDMKLSLEMHKLKESGETHIVLRKLGKADAQPNS